MKFKDVPVDAQFTVEGVRVSGGQAVEGSDLITWQKQDNSYAIIVDEYSFGPDSEVTLINHEEHTNGK